jgi:hypothetical protein
MNTSQTVPDVRVAEIGGERSRDENSGSRSAGAFKQYRVRHGMNISKGIVAIVAVSADNYLTSVKVQNVDYTVDDLWEND